MLTIEFRPKTFERLVGQEVVKKSLLKIVKDPSNAPRTLLLSGEHGVGKTSVARIFARALNCPYQKEDGDACGVCEFCNSEIQDTMFYDEYDSAIIGNTTSIKELRETFYFGYKDGYKVIVFDETHLVSRQAMGALLKILEEPEENVFFILCTTDPFKLLPTILSRSFELRFKTLSKDAIIECMRYILDAKEVKITEDIENTLSLIAIKAGGHPRNALMLLESMLLLEDDFKDVIKSSRPLFIELITINLQYKKILQTTATIEKINNAIKEKIKTLTTFPVAELKQEYELLVLDIAKSVFGDEKDPTIQKVTSEYKNSFALIQTLNDKTIYDLFINENQFQVAMYMLSNKLKTLAK